MKKKLLSLFLVGLMVVTLTGCGNTVSDNVDSDTNKKVEEPSTTASKSKGKCIATECIKLIKPENTVAEINEIIGFEGKLADEKYNKYQWELSDTEGIQVTYYSGTKGNIVLSFDKKSVANDKIDFSKYQDLKAKINDGITYQEFISYIGNVEGTLTEKSSTSTKYVWVKSDGSYLNGSFSNSSGKCTFMSGMIK